METDRDRPLEADDGHLDRNPPDRPDDGGDGLPTAPPPARPKPLVIKIDREEYAVDASTLTAGALTGTQIRRLADPDIGENRDLFEVVPGGSDLKIAGDQRVTIRDGMRFFSAPARINPGQSEAKGQATAAAW